MKTYKQFQEDISKENGKWVLRSKRTGKVLGTHDSKQDAIDQEVAIEISKKERK